MSETAAAALRPQPPIFRHIDVLPAPLFQALQSCEHQPNLEQLSYLIPLPPPSPPSLLAQQCVFHLYHTILHPALQASSSHSAVCLEWWVHSRRLHESMFLHWDRDEGRWGRERVARFPALSSVLFIGDEGGPTLVVREVTDECMQAVKAVGGGGGERVGHLVWPRANSLLVFPGDWLHGVVPVEDDDTASLARRLTLMVNVWTEPLQDPTCVDLTPQQAQSPAMQKRFGPPLTTDADESAAAPPLRVEVDATSSAALAELYRFDLHAYVHSEDVCVGGAL